MKIALGAAVSGLMACFLVCGQSQHTVWVCDTFNGSDCHLADSSVMGGLRYEDYKVTNPAAVQFDPTQRVQELAALGTSTADTLCQDPPSFTTPAPTITFDKTTVVGQIYWVPVGPVDNSPFEFMDVQFSNFTASNGYTSPHFGFRIFRQILPDGTEAGWYQIQMQEGNAGLQNIAGLAGGAGVGFMIDPVGQTASVVGTVPSSDLLREAILGVLLNAQSILSAAQFTVANPAPSGYTLWPGAEIVSLAGQAEPWIAAASTSTTVPIGPPYTCTAAAANGYGVCTGQSEMTAFTNMILAWGGEYLGLRTQQSFNVLSTNLRAWASANAPSVDPAWEASNATGFAQSKGQWALPILMLWPTLRGDPALAASDRETIENWIVNWLVPPVPVPDFWPNDLGYWSDAAEMADAIRRSDNATFAFGVQRFYGALNQIRADGSFPLAAALSACSATYSNADLIHLTSIAEMAATQGYDLWSMSVDGKGLETAIEFLLNAYQNPALLAQYSAGAPPFIPGGVSCFEGNPGDPPDFSLFKNPGPSLAWMEPYIARFPLSTTATRLRAILGTNVSATPFPLMVDRIGLNATCAFRKSYEFQPVNGANVALVSGNAQTVAPNQPAPSPLKVLVTDNTGKPLVGALVSFAVTQGSANVTAPAQVLTDSTGMASASVAMGAMSGPVTVTAKALNAAASFSMTIPGPAISSGGIAGIAGSVPAVTTISPGALFSIYGQNFVPAGTGRGVNSSEIINGMLPTTFLGVCVSVEGVNAPLLDVFPGQINAVAPNVAPPPGEQPSAVEVIVTTGCGTASAVQSFPQSVIVAPAAPEFFYFQNNANGQNPVAAVNAVTGAYVGPAALGPDFAPAYPGDIVTIYASGFGPVKPDVAPGTIANGAAQVTSTVAVALGSVTLDASDVLYAGAAPGEIISQLNIRIPSDVQAGNLPILIQVGGIASPPGAFLAVGAPGN